MTRLERAGANIAYPAGHLAIVVQMLLPGGWGGCPPRAKGPSPAAEAVDTVLITGKLKNKWTNIRSIGRDNKSRERPADCNVSSLPRLYVLLCYH